VGTPTISEGAVWWRAIGGRMLDWWTGRRLEGVGCDVGRCCAREGCEVAFR